LTVVLLLAYPVTVVVMTMERMKRWRAALPSSAAEKNSQFDEKVEVV
jgi:hypothetical protein